MTYLPKSKPRVTSIPSEKLPSRLRVFAGVLLIAGLVLLAYWPARSGGFIMDDDLLLTDNALVKAPDGLYRMWCTIEPLDYWPLTNTTFWLEWRLWGMNPTGYHVTNLLLHIVNCLLIWLLLRRLSIPGAFFTSLLYAVHPVNVESVAWIAQRKNGLSLGFFLISVLWYLKSQGPLGALEKKAALPTQQPGNDHSSSWNRWYWFSLLAFTLGMLSKGSVAVLPLVLLLIVGWQQGRITRDNVVRTLPFFLVAVLLTGVNICFQTHGNQEPIRSVTFGQRLLGAGAVVWFYLFKALWPVNLMFVYPQWDIQVSNLWWWLPLAMAVVVTGVLIWKRQTRWGRPLLFAWGFFCAALVPVMGLTDVYFMKYSLVADHYQYLAILAVLTMVAAGLINGLSKLAPQAQRIGRAFCLLLLCTLVLLTWRQCNIYADAMTLYQTTVDRNPNCWLAYNNLGVSFVGKKLPQKAIECYQTAIRLKSNYVDAYNNLGVVLVQLGRSSEAIEQYRQALKFKPDSAECHNNLGNAYEQANRPQEAIEQFQQALQLKPDYPDAYYDFGLVLANLGQLPEAISKYEEALRLKPNYSKAHNNLGNILADQGRYPEAIEHYQQALQSTPDYVDAHYNMAITFAQMGQISQAIEQFQRALQFQPNNAKIHSDLGNLFAQTGRLQDAIGEIQIALRLNPNFAEAHSKLGAVLTQLGRTSEAIDQFQQVAKLMPESAEAFANMASAYALMNRSGEALAAAQRCLALARSQGRTELAQHIETWLANYRSQHPTQPNSSSPAGTSN